jgi:hypothetical protein
MLLLHSEEGPTLKPNKDIYIRAYCYTFSAIFSKKIRKENKSGDFEVF